MTDMSRFSRSGHGPGPACCGRRRRHVACNSGPDDEVATARSGCWRRRPRPSGDGTLDSNGKGGSSGTGTAGTAGQSGSGGAAGGQATVSEADAARVRAETRCRLLFECCDPAGDHGEVDLPVYEFDSEAACVARFQAYYQGVHDEARVAGLTYDPECLGFEVAGERAFGCGPGPYQEWCVTSDIYRGDVAEGGGCTSNIAGYFSDCQKGLMCAAVNLTAVCACLSPVKTGPSGSTSRSRWASPVTSMRSASSVRFAVRTRTPASQACPWAQDPTAGSALSARTAKASPARHCCPRARPARS